MKPIIETRIIVDTNLWISFLMGRKLHCLLDLLGSPEFQLVASQELYLITTAQHQPPVPRAGSYAQNRLYRSH